MLKADYNEKEAFVFDRSTMSFLATIALILKKDIYLTVLQETNKKNIQIFEDDFILFDYSEGSPLVFFF